MLRRSFRVGLVLGILAGLALAVVKTLQGRRQEPVGRRPAEQWPPAREPSPRPQPVAGAPGVEAPPAEEAAGATVIAEPVEPPPEVPHERAATAAPPPPQPSVPVPPAEEAPPTRPVGRARKAAAKRATKTARKATRKAAGRRKAAGKRAAEERAAEERAAEGEAAAGPAPQAWVEPSGDTCPSSHPIKAKLRSKIFHAPGQTNYDRMQPDRCYRNPEAAKADGLRQAKR